MSSSADQGRVGPRSMFATGAVVVASMLAAQFALAFWLRDVSMSGVSNAVDEVMQTSAESASLWIGDYVSATETSAAGLADLVATEVPDSEQVREALIVAATVADELATLAVQYPDGSWIGVKASALGADYSFILAEHVPAESGHTQTAWLYDGGHDLVETRYLLTEDLPEQLSFWAEGAVADGPLWVTTEPDVGVGDSGVWAVVPVRSAEGDLLAVVGSEIPIYAVADVLSSIDLGPGGTMTLLDADRGVLATEDASELATSAQALPGDTEVVLGVDGEYRTA